MTVTVAVPPFRRRRSRRHPSILRLPAVLAAGLLACVALGSLAARPALAADPTIPPLVAGQHVYDLGHFLSAQSVRRVEALAARIESKGAGRVAVYSAPPNTSGTPNATELAASWQTDGMLFVASEYSSSLVEGTALKSRLTSHQLETIETSASMQSGEGWILTCLARVDAYLNGTHVFDGPGVLDEAATAKAETAAKNLGSSIGATVYVDIATGNDDPESLAFFNDASFCSHLEGNCLVIGLGVSGTKIGGYLDDSGDLFDKYKTGTPWSGSTLSKQAATGGNVQASLLAAIDAVQSNVGFLGLPSDALPWIVFTIVIVVLSIALPLFGGSWLMRKLTGTTGPIKGGLPGDAVIQSVSDTGVTVTMPEVGPDAPEYKLGLQVTPQSGATGAYQVEVKALVPRVVLPMIVPGTRVGVLIDPQNPQRVSVDFTRIGVGATSFGVGTPGAGFAPAAAGFAAGAPSAGGGFDIAFDAAGNPNLGQVAALAGAVRTGAMPSIPGSAAQLLLTGTRGTATITSAMPLGKTAGEVNPAADPAVRNDPIWVFTVEVTLPGRSPFPAVFGHRVPLDKVAAVVPGAQLVVAADQADPSHDVAIDWTQSPIVHVRA